MTTGLISHIQKCCLHDGPGIRTTVFFKGCPLSCTWCHNPETQLAQPEIIRIENRCIQCGACVSVCPQRKTGGSEKKEFICQACGACVDVCPTGACQKIGTAMSVMEVMQEILKDQPFYEESGGGVTFSGGEPLAQPDVLFELLRKCRLYKIHSAVDTCGFCTGKDLIRLAEIADLILYDLKCMDSDKHETWTGVPNTSILQNLKVLNQHHQHIWIRIPVIPGFNNTRDDMKKIARFIAPLKSIQQTHLLPYHANGLPKEKRLGRENRLVSPQSLKKEDLAPFVKPFTDCRLNIRIGG